MDYGDAGAPPDPCEPNMLRENKSVAGCRFFATSIKFHYDAIPMWPGCIALSVSNPSRAPAKLRLRFKSWRDAAPRDEDAEPYARRVVADGSTLRYEPLTDGALGPGESAIVSAIYIPNLSAPAPLQRSQCPTKAFVESDEPSARDDKVTPAVELVTDIPIHATLLHHFHLQREPVPAPEQRYALTPVHLWDTAATDTGLFQPGRPATLNIAGPDGEYAPLPLYPARTFTIASEDTVVTVPEMDGGTRTVKLRRGDVFSLSTNDSAIGHTAHADKPIGLISFAPIGVFPWQFWEEQPRQLTCDTDLTTNMFLPRRAWGSEYVAVRHANRWDGMAEEPAWRVLGGADGTELSYEPYRPEGAPSRVAEGELVVFFADRPFVVRSQDDAHPFYFGGTMLASGYQRERNGDVEPLDSARGQSLSVHTLPTPTFKSRYAFFVAPNMSEHDLVLVRPREGGEVRLDCAGSLTGWAPIDEHFEYLRVPLTRHFEPVDHPGGRCLAGPHTLEGEVPLGATLWGWGNSDAIGGYASAYAFPLAGADALPRATTPN